MLNKHKTEINSTQQANPGKLSRNAVVCYHYDDINKNIHVKNKRRGAPLFLSAANIEIINYAIVHFPRNITIDMSFFTGVPPPVLLIVSIEVLKETSFTK